MKKKIATLLAAACLLAPCKAARAAPYAAELAAPCQMQVADAAGNEQTVTEPQGYVFDVVNWDGQAAFPMADPCGNPAALVPQAGGSPALGDGGVALALSPAEVAQQDAAAAAAAYGALIAGGLDVTFSGEPGLSGTYGVAAADQSNFTSAEVAVSSGVATFPMAWLRQDGSPVSLPSAAVFLELAGAAYKFVDQAKLAEAAAAAGQPASWPPSSVTVP